MSKKRAYIFWGGWLGHEPDLLGARFQKMLEAENFEVIREDTLDRLDDIEFLRSVDLIIPLWTQGDLEDWKMFNISDVVNEGVGIAGCHGGMCDAFRWSVEWQFMTGSQWVSHPGDPWLHHCSKLTEENRKFLHEKHPETSVPGAFWTTYEVNFKKNSASPLIEGLDDFTVTTEQYYLHVDPCIDVLATTDVKTEGPHKANGIVRMPVVYTKRWGKGKVFYNSMGHHDDIFDIPQVAEVQRRGFLWAAR